MLMSGSQVMSAGWTRVSHGDAAPCRAPVSCRLQALQRWAVGLGVPFPSHSHTHTFTHPRSFITLSRVLASVVSLRSLALYAVLGCVSGVRGRRAPGRQVGFVLYYPWKTVRQIHSVQTQKPLTHSLHFYNVTLMVHLLELYLKL